LETFRRRPLRFDVRDGGPPAGEVVVLLHGFPQTSACWEPLAPALHRAGYRTLAPDQRGYSPGARPRGRRAYRMAELVADVVALLDAAGLGRAHVVGHDWGGAVAWSLASTHGDRVASLTALSTPHPRALVASMARSRQARESSYMLLFQLPWLPEKLLAPDRDGGGRILDALVSSGLAEERARPQLAALAGRQALGAALNWYRGLPFGAPRGAGEPVRSPTLHVWGDGDRFLSRKAAELTGRWVQGPYRFEVLDGVSHWIPEEAAGRLAPLLVEHLRRHPA
jgi:pimeloyl-ACP methyl ester carboxylesterase